MLICCKELLCIVSAVAASLTMPLASPTAQDVQVAAAAMDADDMATIVQIHAARRDALLAAVDAATSVESVQAIAVSYAV